jgi:hypothetical protein
MANDLRSVNRDDGDDGGGDDSVQSEAAQEIMM